MNPIEQRWDRKITDAHMYLKNELLWKYNIDAYGLLIYEYV